MRRSILSLITLLFASTCLAALDVNQATVAELDSIKGIGPGLSRKILEEREHASFKDWSDLMRRVKGIGASNATRFSAEGLTVNQQPFTAAKPSPAVPAQPPASASKP